jgi:acetyl esterase/lipase
MIQQAANIVHGHYLATDPLISPLYGNYTGLPPMMFVLGKNEILYDDSFLAAEKARHAGVEVNVDVHDTMFHVYPIFTGFCEEAHSAIERMATYILTIK